MRVLLISANTEKITMPTVPWGLGCVAAAARRAGHAVDLLDLMGQDDPVAAISGSIRAADPQVIGISVRNIDDQNAQQPTFLLDKVRAVIGACRAASRAPIVLGGAGYSIFPVAALEHLRADWGIRGEGERAFCDLLAALERGERAPVVAGLYAPGRGQAACQAFAERLDELPLPGDDLVPACRAAGDALWLPVQTRRGCAMRCSYCSTPSLEGPRVRMRAPGPVLDWLERQAGLGFTSLYIVDNNFNIPIDYATDLCQAMAERDLGLTFRCILNPLQVNETLVAAMARAGCAEVSLGFEAGSAEMLAALGKRFDLDQVRLTSRLLADHGIRRMGFLLLGGPGETVASTERSLAFAASLDLDTVRVTTGIRIYPDTPLHRVALAEGRVEATDNLLRPRFYLATDLGTDPRELIEGWRRDHPGWIF